MAGGLGGGWLGGGWLGGGWLGGGWLGGGWQGGGGGGGTPTFPTRSDRPFADFAVPSVLGAQYHDYPGRMWDPDLFALTILPEFFDPALSWKTRITVAPAPTPLVTQVEMMNYLY
jgi:hypothetical protein